MARTARGTFAVESGTRVDSKGYLEICAGPLRGVRLHRLIAEAKLGRPLRKDEDVHHVDGNKLNCAPENLRVMDHKQHSAVSAKQHWYLKTHVWPREKQEWDAYFGEGSTEFAGGGRRMKHVPFNCTIEWRNLPTAKTPEHLAYEARVRRMGEAMAAMLAEALARVSGEVQA